ncbi:MAG: hypothetical protein FRX48_01407 [Lasallia pustulata]|uniref:Uncharacterized protein n=1 Tax=Lasallia pustulata TaxID=136370 RepID=A0A5M8PYX3_9LECA|nr:MAG: hypothetical protein FRX48_01407 [Lasallia pustulata]
MQEKPEAIHLFNQYLPSLLGSSKTDFQKDILRKQILNNALLIENNQAIWASLVLNQASLLGNHIAVSAVRRELGDMGLCLRALRCPHHCRKGGNWRKVVSKGA